jgi:hypothetical protein
MLIEITAGLALPKVETAMTSWSKLQRCHGAVVALLLLEIHGLLWHNGLSLLSVRHTLSASRHWRVQATYTVNFCAEVAFLKQPFGIIWQI